MQYVGARYVPKFMGTYDNTQAYENMCVVDNGLGTSYISKKPTPAGTPLTDTEYWAIYGASSGAVINLQNQIDVLNGVIITPEMFGAVGDGVHDDTQAINDALESIPGGGVVTLSVGKTYRITSNILIKYSNQTLYGYGATIITDNNDGASYSISARSRAYVTDEWQPVYRLSNIKILGIKVIGGAQECCLVANCDYVTIKDCEFSGSASDAMEVRYSQYVNIENCHCKPLAYYGMMLYQNYEVKVSGCFVEGAMRGIVVKGHPYGTNRVNTLLDGNFVSVTDNAGECISLGVDSAEGDVQGLSITNNVIEYKGVDYTDGICIRTGTYARRANIVNNRLITAGMLILGDRHTISGNVFESYRITSRPTLQISTGANVHSGYIVVDGNTFLPTNVNKPYIFTDHYHTEIINNMFNGGRGGYDIQTANIFNVVKNNVSNDSTNGLYEELGDPGDRFNDIEDNVNYNNVTSTIPFVLVGTRSIFKNNKDRSYFFDGVAPTAWLHYQGEYKENNQPTVQGSVGSQYVITGWVCTATGTPGTWTECRAYTGT